MRFRVDQFAEFRHRPLCWWLALLWLSLVAWSGPSVAVNNVTPVYTAPYNDHDTYTSVSNSLSVDEAIAKWWEAYKRYWGVQPYGRLSCGYVVTYLSNGEATGHFASFYLTGQCGGGNGIFGTRRCPAGYSLSGSTCIYNNTLIADANRGNNPAQCNGSNPINGTTGNKSQEEPDYSNGASFPLRLDRYYNSESTVFGVAGTNYVGGFGPRWTNTFERSIKQVGSTAYARRQDGRVIYFAQSGSNWLADSGTVLHLEKIANGWLLHNEQNVTEEYDASGRLTALEALPGHRQNLNYVNDRLASVSDSFGRSLTFGYNDTGRVQSVTGPDNGITNYAYDAAGNLASVTYPDGKSRVYHYENGSFPHALTGITDENGNRYASWSYDAQGRAISSSHAGGANATSLSYNADGSTTITDALGAVRTWTFSMVQGIKKPSAITQPCSSCGSTSATTTYDANGFVSSRTDFNGHVTQYTHDARGLETRRTEAAGTAQERSITTAWHPTFRLPVEINEPGRRTEYSYDASGNRLSMTVTDTDTGESRTTAYSYTPQGLLASIDGPRTDVADVTTFGYDSQGNLTSITNALGHIARITAHDAHGNPLTLVDPNGVETTLTYDARQRLLSRNIAGAVTGFEYDGVGNLIKLTLPSGAYLAYTYDAAHRLTGIRDSLGNRIHYTLDAAGNRTKEEVFDPANVLRRQLQQEYDNQSRLKKLLGANGQVTEFGYDAQGNRTSQTEANSFTTTTQYDALDRVLKVTDAANGVTEYGYNALDQLTSVTDPKGLSTAYTRNAFGEVTQQTSPDTGATTYSYDPAGNRIRQTNARGITVTYSYDALNRLTAVDYPGTDQDQTWQYDGSNYPSAASNGIGRLTGMSEPVRGEVATLYYDARGNLIHKRSNSYGGIKDTRYAYDADDRLTQMTYPTGRIVTYGRDALGRITGVTTTVSGQVSTLASGIEYLPFGPMTAWQLGNGVSVSREFDLDYRISTLKAGATLLDLAYYYDPRNHLDAIQNLQEASRSQSFDYDALGRLTTAQGAYGTLAFSYDPVGNRLSETRNGVTASYSYPAGSHRLSAITQGTSTTAFAYDAAGNLTNKGNASYTYGTDNRLSGIVVNGSTRSSYARYSLEGQRLTRDHHGSQVTRYAHDQYGRLLAETENNQTTPREYVWLDDMPLALITRRKSTQDNLLGTHPGNLNLGGLWGLLPPGNTNPQTETFYYLADHLNTPQKLIDSQAAVAWDADYEPFGRVTFRTEQVIQPLRYPGQYDDPETGVYDNWFRPYDPTLGRYIQSDPIGLAGGISTYGYGLQNPLRYKDVTGKAPADDIADIEQASRDMVNRPVCIVGCTVGVLGPDGLEYPAEIPPETVGQFCGRVGKQLVRIFNVYDKFKCYESCFKESE
jgi:RHS repeat-associated protein